VTYYYRTKFLAHGDFLGRDYRIPVKVALPADDWCFGLLQVTPLSAFGESVFRHALLRRDVVALKIAGCDIEARIATKGDNTGQIWVYADGVLRGLAKPVFVEEDRQDAERKKAHQKKAHQNG
jgi:hypothetical protein